MNMPFNNHSNFQRRNCDQEGDEIILKYRDPTTEILRMCNVKTEVIPVIIGAENV
jgi:hypothetical protein